MNLDCFQDKCDRRPAADQGSTNNGEVPSVNGTTEAAVPVRSCSFPQEKLFIGCARSVLEVKKLTPILSAFLTEDSESMDGCCQGFGFPQPKSVLIPLETTSIPSTGEGKQHQTSCASPPNVGCEGPVLVPTQGSFHSPISLWQLDEKGMPPQRKDYRGEVQVVLEGNTSAVITRVTTTAATETGSEEARDKYDSYCYRASPGYYGLTCTHCLS
ncbi:hypothetical protein llap_15287 [Limosa lapponica baueri]|uniref:Uncharacterized protein n=1 Tax=Limosa lapponica baueri TaxID=1758121 RepID=A0A2I0TKR4_LIMLA|nr:hypothetical protein llap_15287 [Limosa lapponica baueri]